MFCFKCGAEVAKDANFCQACGAAVFQPEAPAAQATAPQKSAAKLVEPGVKGWLKFLCISLTILSPLWVLAAIGREWNETRPYFAQWPSLETAVVYETWASLALVSFGVFAGYRLWSVHPKAVATAKLYFWVQVPVLVAISAMVIAVADLHSAGTNAMVDQSAKDVLRSVVNSVVWLLFLYRSKRVKATYY